MDQKVTEQIQYVVSPETKSTLFANLVQSSLSQEWIIPNKEYRLNDSKITTKILSC